MKVMSFVLAVVMGFSGLSIQAVTVDQLWQKTTELCSTTYTTVTKKYPATATCLFSGILSLCLWHESLKSEASLDAFGRLHVADYDAMIAQHEEHACQVAYDLKRASWDNEDFFPNIDKARAFEAHCSDPKLVATYKALYDYAQRWGFAGGLAFLTVIFSAPYMLQEWSTQESDIDTEAVLFEDHSAHEKAE